MPRSTGVKTSPIVDLPQWSKKLELLLACKQVRQPLVLAVDDDADSLFLLTEVLSASNYSYVTATNGQAALALAQQHQPDLILLDILLPDLNGIEVLQRLRRDPSTQRIPVIAVTALAKKEDQHRILAAGCDAYLTKPYMLEDLEAKITRHLYPIASIA